MRITAIAARTVRWPIAGTGAARGLCARAAVLLEVRSDRGAIGLGEAAPVPGLSSDTLADAEASIAELARLAPFDLAAHDAHVGGAPAASVIFGISDRDVARGMAIIIVDILEVVDVEIEDGGRVAVAFMHGDRP